MGVVIVVVVVVVSGGRRLHCSLQYVLFESRGRGRNCSSQSLLFLTAIVVDVVVVAAAHVVGRPDDFLCRSFGLLALGAFDAIVAANAAARAGRFYRGSAGAVPTAVGRQVGRTLEHFVAFRTAVPHVHDAPAPMSGQRERVCVPDTAQPAQIRTERVRDAFQAPASLFGGHDNVKLRIDVAAVVVFVVILVAVGGRRVAAPVGFRRRRRRRRRRRPFRRRGPIAVGRGRHDYRAGHRRRSVHVPVIQKQLR